MHYYRIVPATVLAIVMFSYGTKVLGGIELNQVMTPDQQQKTGISSLNDQQKKALEDWLNQKFILKGDHSANMQKQVYLSENIQNGSQLRFSDGSLYAIAPEDRDRASLWITPFQVKVEPSDDPNFPLRLTNTLTGTSVRAKLLLPANK